MYWMKTVLQILWISAALAVPTVAIAQGGHTSSRGAAPHAATKSSQQSQVHRTIPTLTDEQIAEAIDAEDAELKEMMANFEGAIQRLKDSADSSKAVDARNPTGEISGPSDSLGPLDRPQFPAN
jgi:hypothetical protein